VLTEAFFTLRFKTLWCPVGAQHDWQTCAYAHTYQDARRLPSIGYGPQPCPFWSKRETRAAYAQRCPLGLRCPYSHGAKEQLYHPKYFRTVVCRDLQMRGCPRQHLCAFHHRRAERRSPPADDVDYSRPISKETLPVEWAASFLAPPFFQEKGVEEMQAMGQMGGVMMYGGGACWPGAFGADVCATMGAPMPLDHTQTDTPSTQSTFAESDGLGGGATAGGESLATSSTCQESFDASGFPMVPEMDGSNGWGDGAPYYGACYGVPMGNAFYGGEMPGGVTNDNQWWPQETVKS